VTLPSLVDLRDLEDRLAELRATYAAAHPFPHVVLDDVLGEAAFARVAADFPDVDDPTWQGYLHVNETKYGNTKPETWPESLRSLAEQLTAPRFVHFLEELTGIPDLLPDWSMDGGGLHQTMRGGHLNVHTDFTTHHVNETWRRRVNILLYLNSEWRPEWGGQLELWDVDMTAAQAVVEPAGNRMLVFTTDARSYHGHPDPLTCPPGVARRSLALYYFTEEDERPERRPTHYRARPEDGARRWLIWADRTAVDLYDRFKRRYGITDDKTTALLNKVNRLRRRRSR